MQPIPEIIKGVSMEVRDLTRMISPNGQDLRSDCSLCQGTTWVPMPDGRVKRCECQRRRVAEERIRVILQDWPEYLNARLESYAPRGAAQVNALTAIRGDPHGSFFFTGKYSHGKTHLMIAQYRHLALAGGRCILRSARDLMEELRKAEAPADSNREVFETEGARHPHLSFWTWEGLSSSKRPNDHDHLSSQPAKHSNRKTHKTNVS